MSRRALDVVIVVSVAMCLLILAIGGIDYGDGIFRIRLRALWRPLLILVMAATARAWLMHRSVAGSTIASYIATRGLAALLLATTAVYAHYHDRFCGGLDSYGYVSAASLLASGAIREAQPLAALLPFENAARAAAPLGYVVGPDNRSRVPRFPLGLPAVMAVFKVFGAQGPFFVPLVMGFATLVLAFLLGAEAGVAGSGLFAAAIVAADPLFVDYALQPMSDVPAAFWLAAAVWLRLTRPGWAVAAGMCAGMAFLTRPALLAAVVTLGVVTARPFRHTLRFVATLAVFLVVQLILNAAMYGSVSSSGYGPASYLFEMSYARVAANVASFGKGLTYSHTAAVWVVWPAALVVLRRQRWAWQISAVALAAALPYFFYLVFNDWESGRFLLPTIVLVLILSARALSAALASATPRAVQAMLLLTVAFACLSASHRFLQREGVYNFARLEAKYELVGDWLQKHTSDRVVVLAGLHSGSIRYYGLRQTIRWDEIPSGKLLPTLRSLRAHGYEPYAALDLPSEPPLFDSRFASEIDPSAGSGQGGFQMTQIARVRVVNIYRIDSP